MLMAIVLVFSACELQAAVIHSTWVGGEEGEWARASNWDPAIVPDNSDWRKFAVTIDSTTTGEDGVVLGLQQSRVLNQLDCYGEVEFENWATGSSIPTFAETIVLTFDGTNDLTNHGDLMIDNIEIRGDVNNTTKAWLWLRNACTNGGNLYNQAEAMIKIVEEVYVDESHDYGGSVENAGVITVVPSGFLRTDGTLHNTGQINIYGGDCGADEIFDNNSTGTIKGFGALYGWGGADFFRNKGKIYAYGGSLAVVSGGPFLNSGILANYPLSSLHIRPAEDVNNLGTIEVNAGGGVAFDCNMVNEPNAVVKLLGGTIAAKTIAQSAGAIFEGFGGITGNVVINPNGLIELIGPTNIVGDVTIEHNAVLEISNGQTLIVGHTTNNGEIRVVNGDAVFQGGYSGSGIVKKE